MTLHHVDTEPSVAIMVFHVMRVPYSETLLKQPPVKVVVLERQLLLGGKNNHDL